MEEQQGARVGADFDMRGGGGGGRQQVDRQLFMFWQVSPFTAPLCLLSARIPAPSSLTIRFCLLCVVWGI